MENSPEDQDQNAGAVTTEPVSEIEGKVQAQFNEEKWTRVSAKDVSISRFNLLETILQEAVDQGFLEKLKTISKTHLDEYDASVAARYFIGMIALKQNFHDDIGFLKQLLDQFQEISKWAVVEYLSDQMLMVSENRTILRAKATALEKLGKSKEAIPVLEKLARVDRKNPDVALKYADAIISEDLEKSIQFYKQAAEAYAKSLQFEKLKVVWNKLVDLTPEDLVFFRKIERILSGHRQKEILADLYVQLAYHFIKKEDIDLIILLCKKILEYNPNYIRFKKELVESYKKKYETHSLLDDFIRYSGLMNTKKNIVNAIQDFETNIVFDKGNYVFHRSWGVGKTIEINTTEMIIDFHNKEAHRMEIQMALKSLKPLTEDHFWVYQFEKPDELKSLFENDIIEFFKILIRSFGNKISLADIKAELTDKFISAKNWSKWWSKTRVQILKDNLIGVSPQKRDIIELHETPITLSEQVIEKFQASQGFEDRAAVAVSTLKSPEDYEDAIEYILPFFKESLRSFEFDVRLQSIWFLDMLQEALGDDDRLYTQEEHDELVKELSKLNLEDAISIASRIKYPELKRAYAKWLENYNSNWKQIFVRMLLQTPIKIHKTLMGDLVSAGGQDEILEFFTELRKNSKNNAEVFLWSFRNVIAGTWDIPGLPLSEQILNFFRLVRNIPRIEPKGTKLKNGAKDIIIGAVKDDLLRVIRDNKQIVRKVVSLLRDVSIVSDHEREQFLIELKKISPEDFDLKEEDSGSETSQSLPGMMQKTGRTVASQDAIDAMRKEMDHLIKVEIPENSNEIGLAQEKGDLRENSEYKAALENQVILQAAVTRLENQLKEVILLLPEQVKTDEVGIGTKVKLKDRKSGDLFVYSIMDQWDADVDKGIISFKSPLGEALLKTKVGTTASFGSGNREQEFEVISIEKAIDKMGHLV